MTYPPEAVALGDQMHARILDAAVGIALAQLAREEFVPTENERILLEIGVASGIAATMADLIDMGLLRR